MIVVTGTRAQPRSVGESIVPIDVITSDDFVNQGDTDASNPLGSYGGGGGTLITGLAPRIEKLAPDLDANNDGLVPYTLRVINVDGHDLLELCGALDRARETAGSPTMIVAHTIKGRGVSFMEGVIEYHGSTLTEDEVAAVEGTVDGVNAALEQFGTWISPEIWMIGVDPAPWQPEDTLQVALLLQLNLSWSMGEEFQRAVQLTRLGRDRAVELWGWSPSEAREWIPPGEIDIAARGADVDVLRRLDGDVHRPVQRALRHLQRHHAVGATELIDDHRQVELLVPKLGQQIVHLVRRR